MFFPQSPRKVGGSPISEAVAHPISLMSVQEFVSHPAVVSIIAIAVLTAIGRLLIWIGQTQEHKSGVWKVVGEIRNDIKEIRNDIKKLFRLTSSTAVSGGSPLQLTDIGKDISSTIGAKQWVEELASDLKHQVEGKQPFEIQDLCSEYVYDQMTLTPEQEIKVRQCAYEKGLPKSLILDVLMVELRDELLRLLEESPD